MGKRPQRKGLAKILHDFNHLRPATRRKFNNTIVLTGLTALGAFLSFKACEPAPKKIKDASSLGPFPIVRRFDGTGAPLAFIGQKHTDGDLGTAYASILGNPNIGQGHTMRDVAQAAHAAYDEYGIRAIFMEGFPKKVTDEYNSSGKAVLHSKPGDTYIPEIASLLSSRKWHWVPRPESHTKKSVAARARCTEKQNEYLRKLRTYESEAFERARTKEEALELIVLKRDELQNELRIVISPLIKQHISKMHDLNVASIDAVSDVKEEYGGAVVVYGGAHMIDLHKIASEKRIPNVVAVAKDSKILDNSLSAMLYTRFGMPRVNGT